MNKIAGQTGGCACGKVRYRLLNDPLYVHCCHCRWCQRESGSAFNVNMLIEASAVQILASSPQSALNFEQIDADDTNTNTKDENSVENSAESQENNPKIIPTPSISGSGQSYWRCPECQVAVWSNYGGAGPLLHFVRAGTLDNAAAVVPDIHIFTSTKVPWVQIPEGANAVEGYYDSKRYWPAESLRRLEALKGV